MEGRPSARSEASLQTPKPCPGPDPSCGGRPDSGRGGPSHSHYRCRQMGEDQGNLLTLVRGSSKSGHFDIRAVRKHKAYW